MAQGQTKNESDSQGVAAGEKKKENQKDHTPSKVVIRRLPPSLIPEEFLEHVSPLPDYDFFYFVRADTSLGANAFTRAYINFINPDDIFIFRDKFDGYVFLDAKGGEYPAIVEFAPFQKVPKKKPKKIDPKVGLIEQDSDYKKFLEHLSKPTESAPVSLDAMVGEVEAKESMMAKSGSAKVSTPLLEYLKRRREERRLNIAKLKEERRRGGGGGGRDRDRDLDRKRSGKDEADKRKAEKERLRDRDRDRDRRRDRNRDRPRDRDKDKRKERDAPRGERSREEKVREKKWPKEEGTARPTVMLLKNTERDGQNTERKGTPDRKIPVAQGEPEEGEWQQESLAESDSSRGDRKRDDRRGKRGGGGGRWGETREDERNRRPGGKEKGRGSEEERDKPQSGKGSRNYKEEKDQRGYRDDKDSRRNRPNEERGGGDRYSWKDRGGSGYGKEERGGGRDKYRDDRAGGGDRKGGGGGDGWRKKESDTDRRKADKDKPQDRRPESGKKKEEGKKEREGGYSRSKENATEGSKEEKEKPREVEKLERGGEVEEQKTGLPKVGANDDISDAATIGSKPGREDDGEKEAGAEGDEKKRRRKERPERQIYIPRKALERQRQGSPQIAGKGSDEKAVDPS